MSIAYTLKQATPYLVIVIAVALAVNGYFIWDLGKDTQATFEITGQKITGLEETSDDLNEKIGEEAAQRQLAIDDVKKENKESADALGKLINELERTTSINLEEVRQDLKSIAVSTAEFSLILDDILPGVVSVTTNLGGGSGAIVSTDGYIVTNFHVIDNAASISITTSDNKKHSAEIIGVNADHDIAVLKMEGSFSYLDFGALDDVSVGEAVIAIGNPSGLGFTVTEGFANQEQKILIVDDNDASPFHDRITSATFYRDVINNITYNNGLAYNITYWNETINGTPSLAILKSYGTVVWATGEFFSVTPSAADRITLNSYIVGGGKLIISGEFMLLDTIELDASGIDAFTNGVLHANNPDATFSDMDSINITNISHQVTEGFSQNENLTTNYSPGNFDHKPDIVPTVLADAQILARRGSTSANSGTAGLIVFQNQTNDARVVYMPFSFHTLNLDNRTKLLQNSLKWMDNFPPNISVININPNNTDAQDPDVELNFTANVTDLYNISQVFLEFRCAAGAGVCTPGNDTFKNLSMAYDPSLGLFVNASFTPNVAGTWEYRVWANDTLGNGNYSELVTITIEYDHTWNASLVQNGLGCPAGSNCSLGNLTINNTGDFDLTFDLSTNWTETTIFNASEPFTLSAGDFTYIQINLTTTLTTSSSSYDIEVLVNSTTANANPEHKEINATFSVFIDGPFLTAEIVTAPTTATQGDTAITLNATIKNIGNDTANNTYFNWSLPTGWTVIAGNISQFYANLTLSQSVYNNITVQLSSNAAAGTANLLVVTGCTYQGVACGVNVTRTDSAAVIVSCNSGDNVCGSACTVNTDDNCVVATGGGGGGGGTASASGSANLRRSTEKDIFNTSQTFELTRGFQNSFPINVTNTFADAIMYNVTVKVTGFFSQFLSIFPSKIDSIGAKETRTFNVSIISPVYQTKGVYPLEFNITGKVISRVVTNRSGIIIISVKEIALAETRFVTLIIHEVSIEGAESALQQSVEYVETLKAKGFPVAEVSLMLSNAQKFFEQGNYEDTQKLANQIKELFENALITSDILENLKGDIDAADKNFVGVEDTKRLYSLALAAFEREDYSKALQRARDAQLSFAIETRGKLNIIQFIRDYYWLIIITGILLSIGVYYMRNQLMLSVIARKLEDLAKEETTIHELKKEAQAKTFSAKQMSTSEYHHVMARYEKRLSNIAKQRSRLQEKRGRILHLIQELEVLQSEEKTVINSIKKIQHLYFDSKTMSKSAYDRKIYEYNLRRSEVEKRIALLEAKTRIKEKLHEHGKKHGLRDIKDFKHWAERTFMLIMQHYVIYNVKKLVSFLLRPKKRFAPAKKEDMPKRKLPSINLAVPSFKAPSIKLPKPKLPKIELPRFKPKNPIKNLHVQLPKIKIPQKTHSIKYVEKLPTSNILESSYKVQEKLKQIYESKDEPKIPEDSGIKKIRPMERTRLINNIKEVYRENEFEEKKNERT